MVERCRKRGGVVVDMGGGDQQRDRKEGGNKETLREVGGIKIR